MDEHEVSKKQMHFVTRARCPFRLFQQGGDIVLDSFDVFARATALCKASVEMGSRQAFTGPIAKGLKRPRFGRGDRANCCPVAV